MRLTRLIPWLLVSILAIAVLWLLHRQQQLLLTGVSEWQSLQEQNQQQQQRRRQHATATETGVVSSSPAPVRSYKALEKLLDRALLRARGVYAVAPAHAYEVFEGVDVDGHDLLSVRNSKDIGAMRRLCDQLEECAGFNTNGWFKGSVAKRVAGGSDLHVKIVRSIPTISLGATHANNAASSSSSSTFTSFPHFTSASLLIEALQRAQMERVLRVYTYPVRTGTNMATPRDYKYGAETAFASALTNSRFAISDPERATLFFVPVRCTAYRYSVQDRAAGQDVAERTTADVVTEIRRRWPYWDRAQGADHFYLCAHDMGTSSAARAHPGLRDNAIALVNTADVGMAGFIPHKDISLPPNVGEACATCIQGSKQPAPPAAEVLMAASSSSLSSSAAAAAVAPRRGPLAFFAGNLGRGRVRPRVAKACAHQPDIELVDGQLPAAEYRQRLLTSRFCLFLRGHRAWSPRLLDAVWHGCVPVIISDGYQLPLTELINWDEMAVRVAEADIPRLPELLRSVPETRRLDMRLALMNARDSLTWHRPPREGDAFDNIMLQLWRRTRNIVRYNRAS